MSEHNKMTKREIEKKEDIVKGMKKSFGQFRKQYGDKAKDVMYATATKMAMNNEELDTTHNYVNQKVYHDVYGEGIVLNNHSELNENGEIDWYDVQFDHGIELAFSEDVKEMIERLDENFVEEVEQVDEVSRETLGRYVSKASDARGHRGLPTKKVDNRYSGVYKASKRIDKMEKQGVNENGNLKSAVKNLEKAKKAVIDHQSLMKKQSSQVNEIDLTHSDPKKHARSKQYHYDLGKKTAQAGKEKGETSDSYGPYASDYEKGYHSVKDKFKPMKEGHGKLHGDQHKIDANKNNKIDAQDFKLLRKSLKKARSQ
jgi:hypothetical protein